jgi:hypothetical protein
MKKLTFLHPFALAVAPIIFLWSHNFQQVDFTDVLAPALISLAFCSLLLVSLWLSSGNYMKSAATTSLFVVLFFSYGHIFAFILNLRLFRNPLVLHWLLGSYFAILFLAASAVIWKKSQTLQQLASLLTMTSAIIIASSAFAILSRAAHAHGREAKENWEIALTESKAGESSHGGTPESLPDIYYIILDSYGRADNLQMAYKHDNSDFINFLKDKGFYVAEKSCSNYPATIYSLSSSLNMQYLKGESTDDRFIEMLRAPILAKYLQARGYTYVHFNTYAYETRKSDIADISCGYTPLLGREFVRILLRTTALMGVEKYQPTQLLAENTLFMFRKLREIPKNTAPTFAFAHMYPPHHPFIFDRHGNYIGHDQTMEIPTKNLRSLYIQQLMFMNDQIKLLVEYLLENSPSRPVIILQGDHGGGYLGYLSGGQKEWDRFGILNAYYVPENCRRELYESITPVNTFRLLLNTCFGEGLERLPDMSFFIKDTQFVKYEGMAPQPVTH